MSMSKRIDLMRAIGQAYLAGVEPQNISIYGSDVAFCDWDIITPGETSRSVVFAHNGTSWHKVTNGNKTMCTVAYYQLACRGWDYETFNRKTGLCLDVPTQRVVEAEAVKTRAEAVKRMGLIEDII